MPNLYVIWIAMALMSLPVETAAQEVKLVKFLCSSEGGVVDVASRADDLIIGLSPLPSGCAWLPPETYGMIGDTKFQFEVQEGRVARISRVEAVGRVGFSAGLVELLS